MVVVFGSVNLDLVVRVPRLPHPGETLTGDHFAAYPGGKGANQALAAARAGAATQLYGAIGSDAWADPALSELARSPVDLSGVEAVDGSTGVAMIHVADDGENCITIVAGANGSARASQVPDRVLDDSAVILLQLEVSIDEVVALLGRARRRNARPILNAAPARTFDRALLDGLEALIVNQSEATTLAQGWRLGPSAAMFATEVHRQHGCAVVVTRGARGALALAHGERLELHAPAMAIVDTTGAGDAFAGALAAAIDIGAAWPRALAEAVAAGSLACTIRGAQPSMPHRDAIQALANTVESNILRSTPDDDHATPT